MAEIFDHLILDVTELGPAREFYAAALSPLGVSGGEELETMVGFGAEGAFWIAARGNAPSGGAHVAFTAPSREAVDAFHAAALAAGGTDNGAPGLRPDYGENYYAAFVLDPDGNNVEAVHKGS